MSGIAVFHQKDNFALSAKSVVLTQSFDKIVNVSLADDPPIILEKSPKKLFLEAIVEKNINTEINKKARRISTKKHGHEQLIVDSRKMKIAEKYFRLWKTKVKAKQEHQDMKHKINIFLEQLKKHKETKSYTKCQKSIEDKTSQSKSHPKSEKKKYQDVSEIYRSRYQAQQDLIIAQRVKLQEQEQLIEDLKLGIITDETQKSLETCKYEIRDIFRRCSERVKCKITPPEAVEKNVDVIELRTSKASKIVAEMDKRAMERAIRRNIILEKKKLIEEEKRKQAELVVANKKAADEEQKRKNLEAIKERRRLETELEKKRQENRRKFLESINRAEKFHKKKIKRKFFDAFKTLMEIKYEFEDKSELFYKNSLQKKTLDIWRMYIREKLEKQYLDANILYEYKIKRKLFKSWNSILVLRKQSMQVAEDLYDMKLQSKLFTLWHIQTCRQQMIEVKNLQLAEKHYNRRILIHYFYEWRSFPAVVQLEKAKEERKRKWRERVWEILPDYEPCIDI
ncbi:hypothetical protein Trydic_g17836 [Trypoxylus dichotomus]